jgi:FkbM family methyltransferase
MRTTDVKQSLTLLRESGLPVGSVLDVGVQHGTPALMEVFTDRVHHLFEPIEEYFEKIRANYAGISHHLIAAAVSDRDADGLMHTARKLASGQVSHSWITTETTADTRRIPLITLDTYAGRANPAGPMLLKVDVEGPGVPAAILRGAHKTLQQCSAVVIEMTVERWLERATLLDTAGFDLWDLTALCYYGECLWQFDAIFVKRTYKSLLPVLQPIHQVPFDISRWQQG